MASSRESGRRDARTAAFLPRLNRLSLSIMFAGLLTFCRFFFTQRKQLARLVFLRQHLLLCALLAIVGIVAGQC